MMPDKVIVETGEKYHEVYELLTGREWKDI